MKRSLTAVAGAATLMVGVAMSGFTSAAAQSVDYGSLPVNPNLVTDSTAWVAAAPALDPQGQPGVQTVFTHRDGSRTVTDTILVLDEPAGANSAMAQARGALGGQIANAATQPVPVGVGGEIATGTSPDNTRSIAVLTFTEGNTFTTIEFEGAVNDPVPPDLVTDYGKMQAAAIQDALSG
jgi:hypothetical protein